MQSHNIFINYRREDTGKFIQFLYERLQSNLESDITVFLDRKTIRLGKDFAQELDKALESCSILLVVIGEGWLQSLKNRLQNQAEIDFVQHEIATALSKGKVIIPILMHDAKMPSENDLPPELQPLAYRNAGRITTDTFDADIQQIANEIVYYLSTEDSPNYAESFECIIEDRSGFLDTLDEKRNPRVAIKRLANTRKLVIKRQVTVGQSGSQVYVVDAFMRDQNRFLHGFLKVHYAQGETARQRHNQAFNTELREYMSQVADSTPWLSETKQLALLYGVDSNIDRFTPLSILLDEKIVDAIDHIKNTCHALMQWNQVKLTRREFEYNTFPNILKLAVGHSNDKNLAQRRLEDEKASVFARLYSSFKLSTDNVLIRFEGLGDDDPTLPNPLLYLQSIDSDVWGEYSTTNVAFPVGHVHGDVNIRNVLRLEGDKSQLSLIDFDTYDSANLMFIDFIYLELSIILQCLSPNDPDNRQELIWLSDYLSNQISLHPPINHSYRLLGLLEVLKPIHEIILNICENNKEFSSSYWIARIAVGLEVSRKMKATSPERFFALLYSSHSLSKLLKHLNIKRQNYSSSIATIEWPS